MQESLTGRLLVATPLTGDTFARTVILVLHHGDDGAHGLVLNKPLEASVDVVLPEWQPFVTAPGVLFQGGPVGMDTAMGLVSVPGHESGDSPLGTQLLFGGIGLVDLDAPGLTVHEGYRNVQLAGVQARSMGPDVRGLATRARRGTGRRRDGSRRRRPAGAGQELRQADRRRRGRAARPALAGAPGPQLSHHALGAE